MALFMRPGMMARRVLDSLPATNAASSLLRRAGAARPQPSRLLSSPAVAARRRPGLTLAAGAAAGAVGGWFAVAAQTEPASAPSPVTPPFDIKGYRFDQASYLGRLQQINVTLDPMKLFVSEATIREAMGLLAKVKAGESVGATDAELWAAKELVSRGGG